MDLKKLIRTDYGPYNLNRLQKSKIREEVFYNPNDLTKLSDIYPLQNYISNFKH